MIQSILLVGLKPEAAGDISAILAFILHTCTDCLFQYLQCPEFFNILLSSFFKSIN